MNTHTIDTLEASGTLNRYHARALRLEAQLEEARHHMRVLWSDIRDMSELLLDDNAEARAVDMARLMAWATNHLRDTAADMTGDTTTGEYLAQKLWDSVGVRDYSDYVKRAANGRPNDYGVKL